MPLPTSVSSMGPVVKRTLSAGVCQILKACQEDVSLA